MVSKEIEEKALFEKYLRLCIEDVNKEIVNKKGE